MQSRTIMQNGGKTVFDQTLRDMAEFHLAILGPRESYQITAKNYATKDIKNDFLRKDEVITVLANLNEKGYTTWISINDKEKDCIEGVKALCDFWIDVDARPKGVDDRPASKEELVAALDRANKLKNHVENQYAAIGFIAYSGNGYHIHFPLPRFELPPELREQVNKKVRIFAKTVSIQINAKIDNTYDISRKTTLIGTLNKKIPNKPMPTAWDKELLAEGLEPALKFVENARTQNQTLLENILATEDTKATKKAVAPATNHLDIEQLLQNDQKLYDLLKVGDYEKYGYPSRSEAEEAILVKLVMEGFDDAEINLIMENCALGKWQEKGDSYRNLSLEHAREQAAEYVTEKKEKPRQEEFNPAVFAQDLVETFHFKTNQITDVILIYNPETGIYEPYGETFIRAEMVKILDE
jgi:hypothetical protein